LQWHGVRVLGHKDRPDDPSLQKLDALGKKHLPALPLTRVELTMPVFALPLREFQAAVVTKQLDGVALLDAVYDADGKLRFEGLRGSDAQVKPLQDLVMPVLDAESKAIAAAGVAPLDRLKLVPWQPLFEDLRTQFSGSGAPLLQQTRIDRVFFQYDGDDSAPRLWIKGICIFQGKTPPREEHIAKWSALLQERFEIKGAGGFKLAFNELKYKKNPLLDLQSKAFKMEMDGVAFRIVGFDAKGALRIHAFTPKGQEENVRKLLEATAKDYEELTPFEQDSRSPASKGGLQFVLLASEPGLVLQKAVEPFDWQQMLTDVRERFAKSPVALLQQTRIDRAYFSVNEEDPEQPPFLHFKGVCLRTVHDDEEVVKALLQKELSKEIIPGLKYVVKTDKIVILDTPIYALQGEAVARRQNDLALNVLFERAVYAADGTLQLFVLALDKFPSANITKIYEVKPPLPAEAWALINARKQPALIRRDFDWPGALKSLRERFAQSIDPLLQRSRFDAGSFAFNDDRKVLHFRLEGVWIHPPALVAAAERDKKWKSFVNTLIDKVSYEPTTTGMERLTNPSIQWQEDAAKQEAHDGLYFRLGQFDALGNVKVSIMLPTEAQRASVEKIMSGKPLHPKLAPLVEKNLDYQVWNWKEVLPKGQKRLAQGDFLPHRTRLDRIYFQYDSEEHGEPLMQFQGVCLHPKAAEPVDESRGRLERFLKDLLPVEVEHKRSARHIDFPESPIYALQSVAGTQKLDGLLFADARYDELGKLHLIIVLGAPEHQAPARKLVEGMALADNVLRADKGKEQPLLDISEIAWADILKQMQGWLARSNDSLLKKTRLQRGFFSYPASKIGPEFNALLAGIYTDKPAYTARLKTRFEDYVRLYLTERLQAGPVSVAPGVQSLNDPLPIVQVVQAKIAESLTLDGVRLDDASFDADGKLIVHGIWNGKNQQAELDKLIRATLAPAHAGLAIGINFDSLQTFNSPALLHQLRVWVAGQPDVDEVWLERIHFDKDGKVRVHGLGTRPQDKEKVYRKLPERLPAFELKKLPDIEGSLPSKEPGMKVAMNGALALVVLQDAKDDGPVKLDLLNNIAEHLRSSVPKLPVCDGIRIDRTYYDAEGVLHIDALTDRPKHLLELKPFLEGNKLPFDAKRQLGKGWQEGKLTVIPLRPMMMALHEALPAIPEFDGVTLLRVHHDAKNRLVFTVTVIGGADEKECEPILKRLLESHQRWRLRTTAGVVIAVKDRSLANKEQAKRLVNQALKLLQVTIGEARVEREFPTPGRWLAHAWPFDDHLPRIRPTDEEYDRCLEYLDAAVLNNPKDALAWYLRGYVLQTKNRPDLTRRDLRRMAALEAEDRDLRHQRILALELVQGKLRQSAFQIEQDAIVDVSYGWTLRELHESPAAKE
jgi:hypothetical protein